MSLPNIQIYLLVCSDRVYGYHTPGLFPYGVPRPSNFRITTNLISLSHPSDNQTTDSGDVYGLGHIDTEVACELVLKDSGITRWTCGSVDFHFTSSNPSPHE